MRWIDRGPEPQGVQDYAQQFTQSWIDYFQHKTGDRPADSRWRDFRDLLAGRSGNVCWYCERLCQRDPDDTGKAPTVDHFRPRSRFPELTYAWNNWIFSCRRCNADNKQDGWPPLGYVDPCATAPEEQPEQFFDYDPATGDIIPKPGLQPQARERALRTIDDLGLNKVDVRYYRLDWTRRFVADWLRFPPNDRPAFTAFSTQPGYEFAGATLMALRTLETSHQP